MDPTDNVAKTFYRNITHFSAEDPQPLVPGQQGVRSRTHRPSAEASVTHIVILLT